MGLISKFFAWYQSPALDDNSPMDWLAFVACVVILAFLWSRVVKMIQ